MILRTRVEGNMEINQIYVCSVCGNMIELVRAGGGPRVCGGQPMERLSEKTEDEGREKHVPVIEKTENGVKVKVGSIPHPMEEKHYIEWIEIIADGTIYRKHMKPGEQPEAEFCIEAASISAREHCNIHGLWKSS